MVNFSSPPLEFFMAPCYIKTNYMAKEITKKDILNAINAFSSATDKRFEGIDKRFEGIDKRLTKIEATMVTKDYLDDKMSDLRGDLMVLIRKEDVKMKKLIEILSKRKLLSNKEVEEILSMEPFPQLAL